MSSDLLINSNIILKTGMYFFLVFGVIKIILVRHSVP